MCFKWSVLFIYLFPCWFCFPLFPSFFTRKKEEGRWGAAASRRWDGNRVTMKVMGKQDLTQPFVSTDTFNSPKSGKGPNASWIRRLEQASFPLHTFNSLHLFLSRHSFLYLLSPLHPSQNDPGAPWEGLPNKLSYVMFIMTMIALFSLQTFSSGSTLTLRSFTVPLMPSQSFPILNLLILILLNP